MNKKIKKGLLKESFDKYTLSTPAPKTEIKDISFPTAGINSNSFWKSGTGTFWLVVIFISLLCALVSGVLIFVNISGLNISPNNEVSPASLLESSSPSPEKVGFDRGNLKLEILNGGGVAGSAGVAKSFLENLGYKDIAVGNADNFNFETTVIELKESKKDYADLLVNDLSTRYDASASSAFLSESKDFDVVITVGIK